MPSSPPPPGFTTDVHARTALVLAPHFDDEVLGCGGLLARLAADDAQVVVVFLSDGSRLETPRGEGDDDDAPASAGEKDVEASEAYAHRRRAEAEKAAAILGITETRCVDLPDGALAQHLEELSHAVGALLLELRPDLLLVPAPTELSADHRAAFAAVHRHLSAVRDGDPLATLDPRILLYEINHQLPADLLVPVERQVPVIEKAMSRYVSQLERHDYLVAALGRRQFRAHTLPPGSGAVEGYRELRLIDFQTRGAEALWRHLGARLEVAEITEGPRVSVIVRTKDRPELLAEALASLASSQYRQLQVVLVNDGGAAPRLPEDFPFELKRVDLPESRGRAAAANAGIEACDGDYVAFLDDDDRVEAEHYACLVSLVGAAGVRVAYTDAAVVVHELDGEEGWRESERRLTYSRDFDPDLLLLDNYIPFHTLLIERSLLAEAGELDTDLPFFEDWDFLIRLAALTPFHHLPRVTCEYRQFRGGGHHVLGDRPRQRADFLDMKGRVIERHLGRLAPERLAAVIDGLRAETVAAQEHADHLGNAREDWERRYHGLAGTLRAAEDRRRQLEALDERSQAELQTCRAEKDSLRFQLGEMERQIEELHRFQESQSEELRGAYAEIGRLTELVRAMESTRAWRWHQRLHRGEG